MSQLQEAIVAVRAKIQRPGSKKLNEQATKATLIQPILRALGWNVEDIEDVELEYKRRAQDKPVDYSCMLLRTPCLFVEAKALSENLNDSRWANQFMGYAAVAGVEWVVLTNGDEYRLYNSHTPVPVEEKLFRTIRITDIASPTEETLRLLSKECFRENEINVLWKAHFVDRQVKAAVEGLFTTATDPDPSLIRLLHSRVKNLTKGDIQASLRRMQAQFNFPLELKRNELPVSLRKNKLPKSPLGKKKFVGVTMKDLIDAGLLNTPLKLFKRYRGHRFEAEVLQDGTVFFQGKAYTSCSTAADAARFSVIGGTPHTNGWTWWQYKSNGKTSVIDDIRQMFLKR